MALMTLEQVRENFLAAMETLRSSKVRSALTVLGIVIGVSSVISMAAIIQGLNKFVQDKVESLGSRTYFLTRFPPGTDPSRMPQRYRVRRYFEYNYAEYIRQAAPDIEDVNTIQGDTALTPFGAGTGGFATGLGGAADSFGAGGGQVMRPSLITVRPRMASSSMLTLMTPSFVLQSSSASRNRLVPYSVDDCFASRLTRSV